MVRRLPAGLWRFSLLTTPPGEYGVLYLLAMHLTWGMQPRAADWAEQPAWTQQRPDGQGTQAICRAAAWQLLRDDPEYRLGDHSHHAHDGLCDFLSAVPDENFSLQQVFQRLRWGGICLLAGRHHRQIAHWAEQSRFHGFVVERGPSCISDGRRFWPVSFVSRKIHAVVIRKVRLVSPGQATDRFTYEVELVRHSDPEEPIVVLKQVPSLELVIERLRRKHPDYPAAGLEKLARKFVDKIFPTFLTREAGVLLILQEHLPSPYNKRVPRLLEMDRDERGFVRRLKMSWLRNGGSPLSHMEFARQSADLLRAIHDIPRIIHLDLRLDNFVITPQGVGFVDFGSAVREGEDLSRNPLLQSLFGQLMRTSQIQQLMARMTLSGQVTSQIIRSGCHKADKAADFFYLALQFNSPHSNPDLADLIDYDPLSNQARHLSALTAQILRPADPANPRFRSAKDILHGIERIQLGLDQI